MNFFEHQEKAERRSRMLFAWFGLAVMLIVLAVYAAVTAGLLVGQVFQTQGIWFEVVGFWDVQRFMWISGLTVLVIFSGSIYKTHQLKQGGGAAVADMLGGQRLAASRKDVLGRRMLNVVEEMAIASGLPVPPVYVLNQSGINAFAAGFSPSDTIIGVTRGAMELLNRDELQGVIAHEFSHILHGDTRINMRMMGLLHGITLISDSGMMLLTAKRSAIYTRHGRGSHPALLMLGFLLFLVGLIGMVLADLIKHAISRQREFLADASAVQFTRNPMGISNALKTIGGYKQGAKLEDSHAMSMGHFFFGDAVTSYQGKSTIKKDWWATHPPLVERIQRIEPHFRGRLEGLNVQVKHEQVFAEASMGFSQSMPVGSRPIQDADAWLAMMGQPQADSLIQATKTLSAIPQRIRNFAHDPYTARAICYVLLLDDNKEQRNIQMKLLEQVADPNVFCEMLAIQSDIQGLSMELRLPLLDMSFPALKSLSLEQYKVFVKCVSILMKANHKISLFEYTLHRMLQRHLQPVFCEVKEVRVRYKNMSDVAADCGCVLAMLIDFGTHENPKALFSKVSQSLLGEVMPWPPARILHMSRLNKALNNLDESSSEIKQAILKACVTVVSDDGQLHVQEAQALRAIADSLGCPAPNL